MELITVNPLVEWIKNRIKKNKNAILIFNGPTGSGKTFGAISIAEKIAKEFGTNFNINDNVDFKFTNLLKKTMLEQNMKPGTPFVFEEVGAFGSGSASREWQSQANKFFFSFMQTTRHRNQILILTCPHFSFLDAGTRSLVHMQIEMTGINPRKKVSYCKPYAIQVNSRTGKFYFKFLRLSVGNKKVKFKILEIQLPSEQLLKDYEIIKTKYTTELNKSIMEKVKKMKTKVKYQVSCPFCRHHWLAISLTPRQCPKCEKRLHLERTSPVLGDLTTIRPSV